MFTQGGNRSKAVVVNVVVNFVAGAAHVIVNNVARACEVDRLSTAAAAFARAPHNIAAAAAAVAVAVIVAVITSATASATAATTTTTTTTTTSITIVISIIASGVVDDSLGAIDRRA